MKKIEYLVPFLVAAFILCSFAESGLYGNDVKVLSYDDFQRQVLATKNLFIVKFFSNSCGHCVSFAGEYKKAARALANIVNVVATDDPKVMQMFSIKGFPTVKAIVGNGDMSHPSNVTEFTGSRNAKSVVDFALAQVSLLARQRLNGKQGQTAKGTVIELTDDNFEKLVLNDEENVWFVKFYAPWCGHCKTLAPHWNTLSTLLKGKVKVAKLDATVHRMIAEKYEIRGYPTLKIFPLGDKRKKSLISTYEGPKEPSAMAEFALKYANAAPNAIQIVSNDTYLKVCGKSSENQEASFASVCIIAFLPHIYDVTVDARLNQIKLLNEVAKAKTSVPVAFAWAQGGDFFNQIEDPLNLAFGYPAVVAINTNKNKFAVHRGSFSVNSISQFVNKLISGQAPVDNLPDTVKPLPTVPKWNPKNSPKQEL